MTSHPEGLVGAVARRGFFYGWVIVAACFVVQMISAISFQGLSTYVVPLEREFGWSRTTIGLGRSLQQLDAAFGPVGGSLVDRIGSRRMVLVGVVLYAVALGLFSRVDSVWAFYGASALMAVANAFSGFLIVIVAINHWFRRKRTTALGLSVMGFAVSGAVVVPLIVLAQGAFGWRQAALLSGIGVLVVGLPAALLMHDSPERHGLLPDGERPGPEASAGAARRALADFTLRGALRTRAFWLLAAGLGLANAAHSAVLVYQFAHIEGVLSRESAAAVIVALNVFNVAGRILGGYLGDRFAKHALLGVDLLGTALSVLILAFADTLPLFMASGALFGLFWGVRAPITASIQAEYFGRRGFGRIAGTIQTLALPLALAGPVVAGLVADARQEYRSPFLMVAVVFALSAVLYFLARRPRLQAPPPA